MVAYGDSWRLLLWLILAISSATGLVLLSRDMPLLLAILVVAAMLAVGISWLPATRVTMVGMRLSSLCTPVLCWILNYVDRPLQRLAGLLTRRICRSIADCLRHRTYWTARFAGRAAGQSD